MCVTRVMDLLEFWRREAEWQREAAKAAHEGREYEPTPQVWHEPSEDEAETTFRLMPRSGLNQVGVGKDVTRIPSELRDMIRWAEDKKKKIN